MTVRFCSHLRLVGGRLALATALWTRLALATALCALLGALLAAPAGAHRPLPLPPRPLPQSTSYLALGDSLAFGYSQAKFDELLPTVPPADFETGYVNDFANVLKLFDPRLQLVNDGCPGETTESFIHGPCAYVDPDGFTLHHPYAGGPASSQLSDALAYLGAHPGNVNPITIDIGANDALGLIEGCKEEPACVLAGAPATFAHIGGNLALILGELRAAAPHAQIIVLGLYNPFGETLAGGNALTAKLNEVETGVAASVGARFADPLPFFNPPGALEAPTICLLTNMCTPLVDIHPTDLGYRVLGGLVLQQYVLGLPPLQHGPWDAIHVGSRSLP